MLQGKTVYKVVARKCSPRLVAPDFSRVGVSPASQCGVNSANEAVFLMPNYSSSQIDRNLFYLGREYIASVKTCPEFSSGFNSPEEAKDTTADEIKIQGMSAKGTG